MLPTSRRSPIASLVSCAPPSARRSFRGLVRLWCFPRRRLRQWRFACSYGLGSIDAMDALILTKDWITNESLKSLQPASYGAQVGWSNRQSVDGTEMTSRC
jgi:hypothetical protein